MLLAHSRTTCSYVALLGLALFFAGGCDFGAAKQAVESVGVIVELEPIRTTVSGQIVDAATGELVETPVTLRFTGPDGASVVDMYSDPISSQSVAGGVTSFGIRNGRQPRSGAPIRFRVVASAEGYQSTSKTIEIHTPGTKRFALDLLSTDPTRQPAGALGVRDQSGTVQNGRLEKGVTVRTQSDARDGSVAFHLPDGSALDSEVGVAEGQLTVDLSYYPSTEAALDALPGSGAVQTTTGTERLSVVGYLNRRIRDANGALVSRMSGDGPGGSRPRTTVRLPADAVHPSTGVPLHRGDALMLFRYDPEAGTWDPDTTVTVRSLPSASQHRAKTSKQSHGGGADGQLAVQWSSGGGSASGWVAWGTRSETYCALGAEVQIESNGQAGPVDVVLQRSGLRYSETTSVDEVTGTAASFSTLLGESTVAQHSDYILSFTTRDGQTRTISNVDPCSGTYSVTLPEPSSTSRTDVVFRATPKCPVDQKVRFTSIPTVTVYYRAQDAPNGARWYMVGDDKITWVMDDADNPTYVRHAELRLDGLKQDTGYDLYTTYDGERYQASAHVPVRDTATIEGGRVLVPYSQDFSEVCS